MFLGCGGRSCQFAIPGSGRTSTVVQGFSWSRERRLEKLVEHAHDSINVLQGEGISVSSRTGGGVKSHRIVCLIDSACGRITDPGRGYGRRWNFDVNERCRS